MNDAFKKTLSILIALFLLFVAYYGSYLPYQKSSSYIEALREGARIRDWQSFTEVFSVPLDTPSPVGQEELVRNLGNSVVNLLEQNKDPRLVAAAFQYLDRYYTRIIDSGRGMNFTQNLYILGVANELAYRNTREVSYLGAAQHYYEEGLRLSPTRPQFLYGLLGLYQQIGDTQKAKAIAEQIVRQWPGDIRTREIFDKLNKQ